MAHLMPRPKMQFFDSNGDPLSSGKLYTYAAGTSTPLATYTDQGEGTPNANPVILDANGEASVWMGASSYKFVLKDSSDVIQWTVDNVSHINTGAISTAKLANGVLSADASGLAKMADGYLSADTSGRAKMADGFVNAAKLGSDAVTTVKILDSNVTTAKIADGNVTKVKLHDEALYLDVVTDPTSPYTVVASAKIIKVDASGGAKTINLPALASHIGRVLRIVKTDSSFNTVTIDGNGAELVGTTATIKLCTKDESVDLIATATHWVVQRHIPSNWTSYTPTGSWVSNVQYTGFWRRVGDSIDLSLEVITTDAPTSASLTITIPSGLTIDSSKIAFAQADTCPLSGSVTIFDDSTSTTYLGLPTFKTTSSLSVQKDDGDGTYSPVTQAAPMTWAFADRAIAEVRGIPITNWEG